MESGDDNVAKLEFLGIEIYFSLSLFVLFEIRFLHVTALAVVELAHVDQAGLKFAENRLPCLCLLSAGRLVACSLILDQHILGQWVSSR